MRITAVRYYPLYPKDDYGGAIERGENMNTLIELQADNGLMGYGSTYTSLALTAASMRLIEPILLSEPEVEPARISEGLHQRHFWLGRGGAVTHVISGVDIALWDLFGKHVGLSVSRLIGGRYRDKIKPYASMSFGESDGITVERKIEAALARGFGGVKMGWGTFGRLDMANDRALTAASRKAVGNGAALMVDAGGSGAYYRPTYKRALETARMLADYNVEWYEEALRADDIEGYIKLREHSPVRISSCEVLTRRQTFMPWIERGAVDIVQPDSTKVGGLSEALRIAWHAYDHGVDYVGHGWNTAFGLAADLQIAAALPCAEWVEYISPSPLLDNIITKPFVIKDGFVEIPDAPGLGVEPDMERVRYYATPGA